MIKQYVHYQADIVFLNKGLIKPGHKGLLSPHSYKQMSYYRFQIAACDLEEKLIDFLLRCALFIINSLWALHISKLTSAKHLLL